MTQKYIDFNYCIWFVPENTEFLKKFTNGFIPHMTIFSKLDYHVAYSKFNELKENIYSINVERNSELTISIDTNSESLLTNIKCNNITTNFFIAFYYSLKILNTNLKKIYWYPDNPHISFKYFYQPLDTINLDKETCSLQIPQYFKLTNVCLVKCIGHYKEWEIITSFNTES